MGNSADQITTFVERMIKIGRYHISPISTLASFRFSMKMFLVAFKTANENVLGCTSNRIDWFSIESCIYHDQEMKKKDGVLFQFFVKFFIQMRLIK